MISAIAVLANILLWFLGKACLDMMRVSQYVSRTMSWGLSYFIGSGVMTLWMFFMGAFGLRLEFRYTLIFLIFMFVCYCIYIFKNSRKAERTQRDKSPLTLEEWLCLVFVIAMVMFIAELNWAFSMVGWDVVSAIGFNGKVLFFEKAFEFNQNLPHAEYPLHIPLLEAWTASAIGSWAEREIKFIFLFYGVSFLIVQYSFLRSCVVRKYAIFGMALTLSSSFFALHMTSGYMDNVLMGYVCSAFFILISAYTSGKQSLYFLSGLLAGIASFVKPEGAHYAVLLCILLCLVNWENVLKKKWKMVLQRVGLFSFPVAAVVVGYKSFNAAIGLGEHVKKVFHVYPDYSERIFHTAAYFVNNIFCSFNWGFVWPLFVFSSVLIFKWKYAVERWVFLGIGVFSFAVIAGVSFTDSYDFVFPHDVAFSRLLLHFYPLIPVFVTLCLARLFEARVKQ